MVRVTFLPGLGVAYLHRRPARMGPSSRRKPLSLKSVGGAKPQLSRRGATVLSTTASPGLGRDGVPDFAREIRSPRRSSRGRRSCGRGRRRRGRGPRTARAGRPVPTCVASIGRNDWDAATEKSAGSQPGRFGDCALDVADGRPSARARRERRSRRRTSPMFSSAWRNDPFEAVPVTSVKTTSVNIASVVPVRKRLASG